MVLIRKMVIACAAVAVLAGGAGVAAAQSTSTVLVDPDLTIDSGATISTAVGKALADVEDRFVPHRLLDERGIARRAANVTYRLFKLSYFDLPQEDWLLVANHEVFGHGARLRERFDASIGYRIDAPYPYGDGGGATYFEFDRDPSLVELIAVSTAGMEASAVAAEIVTSAAIDRRRIGFRDALRYIGYELDTFSYVRGTGDGPEDPGHDVFSFLESYNELASALGAAPLEARTLRREVFASLANPMLAYAAFGVGRYLWSGSTDTPVPLIPMGPVRYLPMLRYRLTPIGTEVVVANDFAGPWRAHIDVRVGRSPGARPWGISAHPIDVAAWQGWRFGIGGDIWHQPLAVGRDAEVVESGWGGALRGRVERPIDRFRTGTVTPTLVFDVTAKGAGFVPGDPLGGGVVARVGLGLTVR